jgi:hypothetical protein
MRADLDEVAAGETSDVRAEAEGLIVVPAGVESLDMEVSGADYGGHDGGEVVVAVRVVRGRYGLHGPAQLLQVGVS